MSGRRPAGCIAPRFAPGPDSRTSPAPRRRLPALLLLAAAATSSAVAQTAIEPGRSYSGGAVLSSPATGVSFSVPQGFAGGWDPEGELFLLTHPAKAGTLAGVWAYSDGELEEVLAHVGEQLGGLGIQLQPKSAPRRSATEFAGWFQAFSESGQGLLFARARRGAQGNAVVVAAVGPPEEESALEAVVGEVIATVGLGKPLAHAWRAEVGGTAFTQGRYADAYSPGGVGDGSYASQTDASLDLCSNGQYAYEMSSESYLSVDGVGGMSSTRSDQHAGQWWLVADLVGNLALVLEAMDGRSFVWAAAETGGGRYTIDGETYLAAPSRRCP